MKRAKKKRGVGVQGPHRSPGGAAQGGLSPFAASCLAREAAAAFLALPPVSSLELPPPGAGANCTNTAWELECGSPAPPPRPPRLPAAWVGGPSQEKGVRKGLEHAQGWGRGMEEGEEDLLLLAGGRKEAGGLSQWEGGKNKLINKKKQ